MGSHAKWAFYGNWYKVSGKKVTLTNKFFRMNPPTWLHTKTKFNMYWYRANFYFVWTKPLTPDHCTNMNKITPGISAL